ncbi:MAG: GlsB/YeaQ/YmgE family stress response membrane protein [Candidatus Eremiobacteraeota bacterium]|nr:GlsB/YeaQ/YmgE family stress response membrane protein [Candidatus Eremiobacteraeota bacterium]
MVGVILYWVIVGLIVGAIAKYIVPGEGPGGVLGDIVIGIIGAIIGGFILSLLHIAGGSGIIANIIVALIGAVVLLYILRMVSRRSA